MGFLRRALLGIDRVRMHGMFGGAERGFQFNFNLALKRIESMQD